ncbi:hypothetical protein GCM10010347_52270 [Streptomyces cirratus]|uniref:Uncharacterized protein n=1 Tax=Streptomyces cirratus TaxID=68187 RepID=A0ABQ3F2X0_9ACTN|nr:hypothetical protein GCM10010347_52270 [Streptomyces cirratus]
MSAEVSNSVAISNHTSVGAQPYGQNARATLPGAASEQPDDDDTFLRRRHPVRAGTPHGVGVGGAHVQASAGSDGSGARGQLDGFGRSGTLG